MTIALWLFAAALVWFFIIVVALAWLRAAKIAGERYDQTIHDYRDSDR